MAEVLNGIAELKCKESVGGLNYAVIGKLGSCSLERSREMIEISNLGSDFKGKIAGTRSWSMSADGSIDFADGGQKLLIDCYMGKKLISVDLNVNNVVKFSGNAYIESLSVGISAGESATISISMVGTGELLTVKL